MYPNRFDIVNLVAKVDHQFSGSDQVSVRYGLYDVASANARGARALNAPTASASLDNRDQAFGIGNTFALSPRRVNEMHAQITRGTLSAPPSDPIGPAVSIAGVAVFGTLSSSPTGRDNTLCSARTQPRSAPRSNRLVPISCSSMSRCRGSTACRWRAG